MFTEYNAIFAAAFIGLAVLSTVWFRYESSSSRDRSKYIGPAGAAVATIIIGGIWLSAYLPWIWAPYQLTMLLWLVTFVLIGVGVVFAFLRKGKPKWPVVTVAFLSLALNACSLLAFLVMATISPGGV